MKISGQKPISKGTAALIAGGIAIVFALFLAGLLLFSGYYQEFYGTPPATENAVIDFADYPVADTAVDNLLEGKWEFFYNRWIVTDGDSGENDGLISVPGRWTGRELHGEKLPASGYASYRITLKNIPEGCPLFVHRKSYLTPFRVFINGQLNAQSGILSKEPGEGWASGLMDEIYKYPSDGEDVVVVIELGYSATGGLNTVPWLCGRIGSSVRGEVMKDFSFTYFGFAVAVVLASVMFTVGFYRYQGDISLPLLVLGLFFVLLFSKDIAPRLSIPFSVAMWLGILAHLAVLALVIWHLWKAGMRFGKPAAAVYGGCAAVIAILLLSLIGRNGIAIPALLTPFLLIALCYPVLKGEMKPLYKGIYCALLFVLSCIFAFELAEGVGLVVFGTELFLSVLLTVIIALFAAVGFFRIRNAARDMLRASELEQELQRVKQQALKAQIKPHFVFNSLTAIQSLYHKDVKEGDEALEHFARHLRLNVDADGAELVPFEQEIKNILNYFELENLRLMGKLTLLLDINCTDFRVPVLSLQPLVENAIRYAETADMENGYISIASNPLPDGIEIVISDNGKGFDPASVPEGVGLTNTRERLMGLIGAKMTLSSAPGQGTVIRILIPAQTQGETL